MGSDYSPLQGQRCQLALPSIRASGTVRVSLNTSPMPLSHRSQLVATTLLLVLASCGQAADSPALTISKPTRAVRLEFKERREKLTEADKRADAAFNAAQFKAAQQARTEAEEDEKFLDFIKHAYASKSYGRGGVSEHKFEDEVPPDLRQLLFTDLDPDETSEAREVRMAFGDSAAPVLAGYSVVALLDRDTAERDLSSAATATVSHILIGYKGAAEAAPNLTRTKEEARTLAGSLRERAVAGEHFETLVMTYSDDFSKTENRGRFEQQVIGEADPNRNAFVREFNDAVVAAREGSITEPIETAFGFHIIHVEQKAARRERSERQPRVSYAEIYFPARVPGEWRDTGLTGENVTGATAQPAADDGKYEVVLSFDPAGTRLFREITMRNIGKPVAIFLDGHIYSEPVVQSAISNGEAVISGSFDADTAAGLARSIMQRL
jgi:parvulin-like peptidyl-prolyl isomerase